MERIFEGYSGQRAADIIWANDNELLRRIMELLRAMGAIGGGILPTPQGGDPLPRPENAGFIVVVDGGTHPIEGGGSIVTPPDTFNVLYWDGAAWSISYSQTVEVDPTKDTILYSPSVLPLAGSYVDGTGRVRVTNDTTDKWTGYMPVSNDYPLTSIGYTSGYFTGWYFFDENYKFIAAVTVPTGNGTVATGSIPVNARYVARNLSRVSAGGPDDSGTVTIFAQSELQDAMEQRAVEGEIERVAVNGDQLQPRIGITKLVLSQHQYQGTLINGTTGATSTGSNVVTYAQTQFIDIHGASKIIIGGVPLGLPNSRWFYDDKFTPLAKVERINGVILQTEMPAGAKYLAFTTKYLGFEITSDAYVWVYRTPSVDGLEFIARERHTTYTPADVVTGAEIHANGTVWTPRPDSAWSGYVPVIAGMDIVLDGIGAGFNTKAFYDADKAVLSTYIINNGTIPWSEVPAGAQFIGFNVKTPNTGDSSATANAASVTLATLDGSDDSAPFIAIPAVVPVVVGLQANIYMDNVRSNPVNDATEVFVLEGPELVGTKSNPYIYQVRQTERAIQWQPTTGGQTLNMVARLRDRQYRVLAERSFDFISVPVNAGTGQRKVCILAGDSQIDPTYDSAKCSFAPFLRDMFDQNGSAEMIFVGQEPMTETVFYGATDPLDNRVVTCPTEGYGGRQINWFYENTSPFWNPAINDVDMLDYMDRMKALAGNPFGLEPSDGLDFFVFPMGVNDFNAGVSTPNIIGRMKTMQDKVWASYPDCVFMVGMVTQGSKFWSMDVRRKWNIEYYDALIKEFETPAYAGRVALVPAGLWTDNIFGSRQIRPYRRPYKRIEDSNELLVRRLMQTSGLTRPAAEERVLIDWGFDVEERVMERWMAEFPGTTDIVHSAWVSAMQQADAYYSSLKYQLV